MINVFFALSRCVLGLTTCCFGWIAPVLPGVLTRCVCSLSYLYGRVSGHQFSRSGHVVRRNGWRYVYHGFVGGLGMDKSFGLPHSLIWSGREVGFSQSASFRLWLVVLRLADNDSNWFVRTDQIVVLGVASLKLFICLKLHRALLGWGLCAFGAWWCSVRYRWLPSLGFSCFFVCFCFLSLVSTVLVPCLYVPYLRFIICTCAGLFCVLSAGWGSFAFHNCLLLMFFSASFSTSLPPFFFCELGVLTSVVWRFLGCLWTRFGVMYIYCGVFYQRLLIEHFRVATVM